MSNLSWRILTVIVFVFLACYVSFQAYRLFYTPYTVETVYTHTLSDMVRTRAVILRDEQVISTNSKGVLHYLFEDGARVLSGAAVAEVYASQEEMNKSCQVTELTQEIAELKATQQTGSSYMSPDTVVKKITDQIGEIYDMTSYGIVTDVGEYRDDLLDVLNRRLIVTGREIDFSQRIQYLQNELAYTQKEVKGGYAKITTPVAGYFASTTDGFEKKLAVSNMDAISVADLDRAIAGQLAPGEVNGVGRIILSHNWYVAISVTADNASKFCEGLGVSIDFNQNGLQQVPASVYRVLDEESTKSTGSKMVILRCNYITPELISMRTATVSVSFRSYTGYKINSEAVRFLDGKKGVYVVQGKQVVFKTIETIYEEPSFVLCNVAFDATRPLKLFDQVIIEGTDLYDGKYIG